MKKSKPTIPTKEKKIPFLYRSFLNFWMAIVLPASILTLVISKLYYNNTINIEPLSNLNTWLFFLIIQVFVGFFSYIWIYSVKSKSFDK